MNTLVPQKGLLTWNRTPGSIASISSTGRRYKAVSRTGSCPKQRPSAASTGAKRSSSRSRTASVSKQSRSTGHARDQKHRGRSRDRSALVGVGVPSPGSSLTSSSSSHMSSGQKKVRSQARSEPPAAWRQSSQANRKKTPDGLRSGKARSRTPKGSASKNQDRFIPNRARTVVRMRQVRAESQGFQHTDEIYDSTGDTQTFSSTSISSHSLTFGGGDDAIMDDLTNSLSGFGINSSSRRSRSNSVNASGNSVTASGNSVTASGSQPASSRSRSKTSRKRAPQVDENADPQTASNNSSSGGRPHSRSRSRTALSSSRPAALPDEVAYSPAHSRSSSMAKRVYREHLDKAVGMANPSEPMLCFSDKPVQSAPMRSAFDEIRKMAADRPTVAKRKLPSMAPHKILDAPEICDDYFSNLMAWSEKDVVAIALRDTVYLWNSAGGEIWPLPQFDADRRFPDEDWIYSAVRWLDGGSHLATARYGRYDGAWRIDIWVVASQEGIIDPSYFKMLRTMQGRNGGRETGRIGALAWSVQLPAVIFAADSKGDICLHDMSVAKHFIAMLRWHAKDRKLCGLEFNVEQNLLASGGGDCGVAVWDLADISELMLKQLPQGKSRYMLGKPKFMFEEARSATKALAWCPWQKNLLAVGSGMEDPAVRFYDCNSGKLLQTARMKAQITGLVFSPHNDPGEIITSHGGPTNSIIVWSYPDMTITAELPGHGQSRVIDMKMDPHGRIICTAGADESLKFWTVFEEAKKSSRPKNAMEYSRRFSNSVSLR